MEGVPVIHPNWYTKALMDLCREVENRFVPEQRLQAASDVLVQTLITAQPEVQAATLGAVVNALAESGAGDMLRDLVVDAIQEAVHESL